MVKKLCHNTLVSDKCCAPYKQGSPEPATASFTMAPHYQMATWKDFKFMDVYGNTMCIAQHISSHFLKDVLKP
jgi:uncharacterized protein YchJ